VLKQTTFHSQKVISRDWQSFLNLVSTSLMRDGTTYKILKTLFSKNLHL